MSAKNTACAAGEETAPSPTNKKRKSTVSKDEKVEDQAVKKVKRNAYDEDSDEEISMADLGFGFTQKRGGTEKEKEKAAGKKKMERHGNEDKRKAEIMIGEESSKLDGGEIRAEAADTETAAEEATDINAEEVELQQLEEESTSKNTLSSEIPALLLANKYDLEADKPDITG